MLIGGAKVNKAVWASWAQCAIVVSRFQGVPSCCKQVQIKALAECA
jgi:hypothetical protein